jgi:hypothetical protein
MALVRIHRRVRRDLRPSIAITPNPTNPAFLHSDNTEVNNSSSAVSRRRRNSAIVESIGHQVAQIGLD